MIIFLVWAWTEKSISKALVENFIFLLVARTTLQAVTSPAVSAVWITVEAATLLFPTWVFFSCPLGSPSRGYVIYRCWCGLLTSHRNKLPFPFKRSEGPFSQVSSEDSVLVPDLGSARPWECCWLFGPWHGHFCLGFLLQATFYHFFPLQLAAVREDLLETY